MVYVPLVSQVKRLMWSYASFELLKGLWLVERARTDDRSSHPRSLSL